MSGAMKITIELDHQAVRDLALLTRGGSVGIDEKVQAYVEDGIRREVDEVLSSCEASSSRRQPGRPKGTGRSAAAKAPREAKFTRVDPGLLNTACEAVRNAVRLHGDDDGLGKVELAKRLPGLDRKVLDRAVAKLVGQGTLRRVGKTSKTRYVITGAGHAGG